MQECVITVVKKVLKFLFVRLIFLSECLFGFQLEIEITNVDTVEKKKHFTVSVKRVANVLDKLR